MLGPCECFAMMVPSVICKFSVNTCYTEQPFLTHNISVHFVFNIIWPVCILVYQMSFSDEFYQHKLEVHMIPYQAVPFCHHFSPRQHRCLRYQNRSQQFVSSYVNGCPQHQNRWHHSAPHVSASCMKQVAVNYIPMGHVTAQHFCSHLAILFRR